MNTENISFENKIQKLNEFYQMKQPENIITFIKDNEKLIELLNETKILLKKAFPQGTFELEMYHDLSGEGLDHLLLNIYVDKFTFNNGLMDKIYDIDMKILPLQKELDLAMALNLMPGVKSEPN